MTSRGAPPRLQPEAFLKILKLERRGGYKDTAVIGGLDGLRRRRDSDLTAMAGNAEAADFLTVSYSRMALPQRKKWVDGWLAKLQTGGAGAARKQTARTPPNAPKGTPSGRNESADSGTPTAVGGMSPQSPAEAGPTQRGAPKFAGASIDSPVDRLRGVDTKLSAKLRRLGVSTVRDMIYLLPRRHNDYSNVTKVSELVPGEDQTIVATVWEARETKLGRQGRLKATEAVLSDETGNIKVVWFGRPHVAKVLKPNSRVAISGRVDVYRGQMQFESPEFEMLDGHESLIHTGRLVPVYPLTEGLTPRRVRSLVWQALERWGSQLEEFMPEDIRTKAGLPSLPDVLMGAHYPDDADALSESRRRLAFDELFLIQLAVLMRRKGWQDSAKGIAVQAEPKVMEGFLASLHFKLTVAQERCLGEILADIKSGTPPMNRLLQGEVGSGKTVVALAAILAVASKGYQGSIMVPTEVLAEQHFATVSQLLGGLAKPLQEENVMTVYVDPSPNPISVGLLTGSTKPKVKRELQRRVSEGSIDIIIGTHALIQESVDIPRLALAVADEQHRFGVMQRAALRQRGSVSPHVLVMSATPIPRTLALTIYGDLDVSTIDQMPAGRQIIRTRNVPPENRDAAYKFVRKEVQNGRQAFVICPLIEESEAIEARAAVEEYERLSTEVFPDLRVSLLHGRMASREKEAVMRGFRDGQIDVLVSTAVVEVGIDVPNATVMAVEGAHRFGLSQLHQFRGRVGRGEHKSYCILLSEYSSEESRERLSAMENIHDGFKLAEVDLYQRGPGDLFGTRQSGLPALRVASLGDHDLLEMARDEATVLLRDDPGLESASHEALSREVSRFRDHVGDEVS